MVVSEINYWWTQCSALGGILCYLFMLLGFKLTATDVEGTWKGYVSESPFNHQCQWKIKVLLSL